MSLDTCILVHEEELTKNKKKYKLKQSASSTPEGGRKGGGDPICNYIGCERIAWKKCPYCQLLYCGKHIEPIVHNCPNIPYNKALEDYHRLNLKYFTLPPLSKDSSLAVSPEFTTSFSKISKEEVRQKLASKKYYHDKIREFINKIATKPKKVKPDDFIKFILSRLAEKIYEFSKKYGYVIVMDQQTLKILSNMEQEEKIEAKFGGLAFQWWMSLELIDIIHERANIIGIDSEKRRIVFEKDDIVIDSYFDSYTVHNSRPDILLIPRTGLLMIGGIDDSKIIEIKLTERALLESSEQIQKYISIWGYNNIKIIIGTPCFEDYRLNINREDIFDSMAFKSNDEIKNTLSTLLAKMFDNF